MSDSYRIRRATADDAAGIANVLQEVADEQVYSAITRAWPVEDQRSYLESLSVREAFHVAETASGKIIGYQSLDRYSTILDSMAHVASLGTFVCPEARKSGVGHALWAASKAFASQAGYRKIVIQVRASNSTALRFYTSLGFQECGRLNDQVLIDGQFDGEVLLELFITRSPGY